jgi:hypothetical protein
VCARLLRHTLGSAESGQLASRAHGNTLSPPRTELSGLLPPPPALASERDELWPLEPKPIMRPDSRGAIELLGETGLGRKLVRERSLGATDGGTLGAEPLADSRSSPATALSSVTRRRSALFSRCSSPTCQR